MPNQQRLRARLLEFLKFRVLAAQDEFFTPWQNKGDIDCIKLRDWLAQAWPEALSLDDEQLKLVLKQARDLYVN